MPFLAQNNLIKVDNGSTNIFSTNLRMPHIISTHSGILYDQPVPLNVSGSQYWVNSSVDIPVAYSSNFKFANSFVYAYIKPVFAGEKTEIDTNNPMFVAGTICTRIYIEANGYRGAYLLTPRVWDGYIGFTQEHTYNYNARTTPPTFLGITADGAHVDPGVRYRYTLYYGRFI